MTNAKLTAKLTKALADARFNPRACLVRMRTNGQDPVILTASSDPVYLAKAYRLESSRIDPMVHTLEFRSAGVRIPLESL